MPRTLPKRQSPQPARRPATLALAAALASLLPAALAWSCGLDVSGTQPPRELDSGASPGDDAHLPPPGDANFPDGAPDANADADAGPPCPTGRGPTMVLVQPGPDAGDAGVAGPFCIDSTEVTNAQYDEFLAATDGGSVDAGAPATWPTDCRLGTPSFARAMEPSAGSGNVPVVYLSWCSAYAFCAWSGKRLCGDIPPSRIPDAGEWYTACSSFGTRTYPYGTAYQSSTCNDNTAGPSPAGAFAGCEGGVPGVVDMAGNVFEYIDSCTPTRDTCRAVGGDYAYGSSATCTVSYDTSPIAQQGGAVGFRCCADAK
jgi:hypothetical protein